MYIILFIVKTVNKEQMLILALMNINNFRHLPNFLSQEHYSDGHIPIVISK